MKRGDCIRYEPRNLPLSVSGWEPGYRFNRELAHPYYGSVSRNWIKCSDVKHCSDFQIGALRNFRI